VSFSLSQFYSYDENTIQKDWQISCSCFFSILKKNFPSIVLFVLHLRFAKKRENYIIDHKGSHSLNAWL
jgi:hypothetical protein